MKKLIPILMALVLLAACKKEECKDEYCPAGYICVDGVCESTSTDCPIGYEGQDCATASNAKFAGNYNVVYTGSGGLSNSNGNTTTSVATVNGKPDKIRIDVTLDVSATVVGTALDLPLEVSIEASVDGNTYNVPSTSIVTEVDLGLGFPLPVELTFRVDGTKIDDNTLNSTLVMSGALAGTITMVGTK